MKKILTFILCPLSFALVLAAQAAVSFNPSSVTVEVGETVEVTATGGSSDSSGYTGVWTTSFSPTGRATASATRTGTKTATVKFTGSVAGTTTCTVTHQYRSSSTYKETGTITVTVTAPPLPPPGKELSGGLRISEVCPKPQRAYPTTYEPNNTVDDVDPNGVPSGWVELVNAGETPVDIGEYELQRFNRGKKASAGKFVNLPARTLAPGERVVIWTNEGYIDGGDLMFAEPKMTEDEIKEINGAIIFPAKVSPKKFPMVRLLKGKTVIDTVIVPADTPDGCSIVVRDPDEDGATCHCLVTKPTPGAANEFYGMVRVGPQIGPLYGVKQEIDISDLDPQPPAKANADYEVVLDVNPVFGGTEKDEIASVTLVYRTDVNSTATAEIAMTPGEEPDPVRGRRWAAAIPAGKLPKPGMLIQWKAKISDAGGNTWTSPAFNDKDNGYEWYGTVVDPGVGDGDGQNSPTLPTLHLFAADDGTSTPVADKPGKGSTRMADCMMNQDYDEVFVDPSSKKNLTKWAQKYPYGARCAVYDFQTSNYYDNVRIDCRGNSSDAYYKKSHGLRFSKLKAYRIAKPFKHPVSDKKVEEVRKTSLHGEYNDPSYFRQRMSFWLMNKAGVPAPWEHPKRVNLNGQFYQFAYETPRFGDELLEDFYGFDPRGSGYKNIGAYHAWHTDDYGFKMGTSANAGTKKKLPDDGNEKDFTELTALMSEISAAGKVTVNSTTRAVSGTDNAQLTAKVVEKFDLPAWINYLAATRITQEGDDVWGNLGGYYESWRLLDGTMGGSGTWRPVAWDMNCAWGQFYQTHLSDTATKTGGIVADQDWNKCHPFYGGRGVKCYGSPSYAAHFYKDDEQPNYAFEAVFQSSKFRRLFLRRLRTLMDAYLKEPDTLESETPIALEMQKCRDEILAECQKDRPFWGTLSSSGTSAGGYVCCWSATTFMSESYQKSSQPDDPSWGYRDIWDHYIVPRRVHLFETHSVDDPKKKGIGYGVDMCAGIPHAQSAFAGLAAKISLRADVELGAVVVENRNAETIDLSGWQLTGPVEMTLPPGTVLDQGTDKAPGELYVTADRRTTVARMTLADQVVVGNGAVGKAGDAFTLAATDGATVIDAGVTNLSANVRISEVQTANDGTLEYPKGTGEYPDWIEIYNAGDEPVDVGGWGLSDKESKPFKWTFPLGAVIPAKGHLVVYAETGDGPFYTGLSLSAGGDSLYLTDWKGTTVDMMTFGAIPCDRSYGRTGDGKEETFFYPATPGSGNPSSGYLEPLGPVTFSPERGVFTGNTNFIVTLTHDDPEATIYYTTDHSDPTEKSTLYTGPIAVKGTTVIRATAVKPGHLPCRNITTHSYLYLDQIVNQKKPSNAPDTWSDLSKDAEDEGTTKQGSCTASYTVSTTSVLTSPEAKAQFLEALGKAPVMSVTISDYDLFDKDNGIYCKPVSLDGKPEGTRPASVEWVTGNHVFCTDAGLSAHGDASRHFDYMPKKSFNLKFRARYGASKLAVPVMDDIGYGCDEFKKLVLRGESNHSWTHIDNPDKGTSMHDQFLRDVSGEMTGFQSHGNQVHLFINGLYWGLYNVAEAMDNDLAASLWGGDGDEYDVVSGDRHEPSGIEVNDGKADDFNAVANGIRAMSAQVTAKQVDEKTFYEKACAEIDLDRMIDYLILEWYVDNSDWPQKNWKATISKANGVPLTYLAWDLDTTLIEGSKAITADPVKDKGYKSVTNCVQYIERALEVSAEYKLRFADRVHRHFYNEGALVAERLVARYKKMSEWIRPMVFAEVARWGAYRKDYEGKTLYNMDTWDREYKRLTDSDGFFMTRWTNFKTQLKNQGLYPNLEPAEIVNRDDEARTVKIAPPRGTGITVYYTTDGSDPRTAYSGAVGATATAYDGATIAASDEPCVIKARAWDGTEWSALSEAAFDAKPNCRYEFNVSEKEGDWNAVGNWLPDDGYPNAPDAIAVIGKPAAVSKKNWRNVDINGADVTVRTLEFANEGMTNRVDSGKGGGSLTLCGKLDGEGKTVEPAAIVVTDEANAGYALIDLDPPNAIRFASDVDVIVSNAVGDAEFGGLRLLGLIDANGHDLHKLGSGRLTLSCENAVDAASRRVSIIGKLQCEEGVVAVEGPLHVGSVTKKTGDLWVKMGGTDLSTALEGALVSDGEGEGKVNPNLCLFVGSEFGGETWYGGVVARELKPASVTVYVPDAEDDVGAASRRVNEVVRFCGKSWRICEEADVKKVDAADGLKTYEVTLPHLKPLVTVGDEEFYSVQEALDAANTLKPLVFAVEPLVEGRKITANGDSGVIKDCYDIEQDGKTLTLKLTAVVRSSVPVTINFVTWKKGQQTYEEKPGVTTQPGFWYAYGKDGTAATEWVEGDGTPQALEPPAGDGWEILVSDVKP